MSQLRFRFAELVREVSTLRVITRDYLDSSTLWALDRFKEQLEHIWEAVPEATTTILTLPSLSTIVSPGHYEPIGGTGSMHVYAKISGTWEVKPVGHHSKKEKGRQKRSLEFCGIASTRIELYEEGADTISIAMWKMELGDSLSPGCYFHVHVLGDGESPFPKAVSVPRLPSLFITPMAVVEYVIGELFQDRWAQAVAEENGDILHWRSLQKERFIRLFNWQKSSLEAAISTPWMTLKAAKPPGELFLE
jgi:hypothetical protein